MLSGLTSAAVAVALCGGTVSSLREQIADRPPPGSAVLPGALTGAAVAVALAALLVAVLARLGPVSATPATAAWWLPLPAGRRGLLRGELRRAVLLAVAAAVTVGVPVVLALTRTPGGVLAGVAAAALLAAAGVGLLVVRQARGDSRWVPGACGAVAAAALVGPAVLGCVAAAAGARVGWPAVGTASGPVTAGVLTVLLVVAVLGLAAADRRLADLPAGALRASGETAQYATASVVSLDTR